MAGSLSQFFCRQAHFMEDVCANGKQFEPWEVASVSRDRSASISTDYVNHAYREMGEPNNLDTSDFRRRARRNGTLGEEALGDGRLAPLGKAAGDVERVHGAVG